MTHLTRRVTVVGIWLLVGALLLGSFGLAGLWRSQSLTIAAPISGSALTQGASDTTSRALGLSSQISDTEAAINSLNAALSGLATNASADAATLLRLQADLATAQADLAALQARLAATPSSPPIDVPGGDDGGGND
jgi:hypothetical protein